MDPASLTVELHMRGLDSREAAAVITAIPAGASWEGTTDQPPLGGRRHQITITDLSIVGAADVTAGLLEFAHERAQMGGSDA